LLISFFSSFFHFYYIVEFNLGYRIIASSLLPITKQTIIYGSNDAGRTYFNKNPTFDKIMKKAAEQLNLAGHYVGPDAKHFQYTPADLEGHASGDGRYYVVDTARLFPPQTPSDSKSVLYNQLRPEYVKTLKEPLSSDSFSVFDQSDRAQMFDQRVLDATLNLFTNVVEFFAHTLNEKTVAPVDDDELREEFHRRGNNETLIIN
jgi:hypothetical protein